MSLRCMVWVFNLLSKGKVPGGPSTALVFLKLADRSNDDGVCWPGLDTLGRDVGLSRRTVERALAELVLSGLVRKNTRRDSAGRDLSNVYHLALDDEGDECDEGGRQIDGGGRQIDGGGLQIDAQTSKQKLSTLTNQRGARAGGAKRPNSRGGMVMVENEDGITFNPGDPRDAAILADIRQHPTAAVARAVKAAREGDPLGRAFPSAIWRHLRKQAEEDAPPPWARVVGGILSESISPQAEALRYKGKGGEE